MANLHDIERRINSVESTKQITRTMQMVAAAKIRHSMERVEHATPYRNARSVGLPERRSDVRHQIWLRFGKFREGFYALSGSNGLAVGYMT